MGKKKNPLSDLHGAPGLHTGVGHVHIFFDSLRPTARLVAGKQTPAAGSEVGQHGRG